MRFSAVQKHRLYGEIAKLLRAGFSIDDAAKAILERRVPSSTESYLKGLRDGLSRHCTIGEAVAESTVPLTPLEISIVVAGERGGRLEDSYEHLSSYFGMLDRTQKQIRASLIYPIVLLHVAIILPAIPKAIFAGDASLAVRSITLTLIMFYGVILVSVIAASWAARAARENSRIDGLIGAIPLFGKARRALALARFCKVFHIHLLAALPITSALRAAGEASQSGRIWNASDAIAGEVERGATLSEGLGDEPAFPGDLTGSLSTAELTGTLDVDLERWSQVYQESSTEALDAIGGWFPKVIYVLVVIYVIWQIFSMGLAYLGAIEGFLPE